MLAADAGRDRVNWYVEFDKPQKDDQGHPWVARDARKLTASAARCA